MEQITKSRELETELFNKYLQAKETIDIKAFKYMITNQRRNIEQLITMYRDAQDVEPEDDGREDDWDTERDD